MPGLKCFYKVFYYLLLLSAVALCSACYQPSSGMDMNARIPTRQTGYFLNKELKKRMQILKQHGIECLDSGDRITLVVPTDRFFHPNSADLKITCLPILKNIVDLIFIYPRTPVYVAAFTDNVGSFARKKNLSQAQAEAMATFFWTYNIAAEQLRPEGHADYHPVSENKIIHGSAQNRRIEIQWLKQCCPQKPKVYYK